MIRKEIRAMTDEYLTECYREKMRRWRKTHKDSIRLSNWKYHKKIRSKLG